MVTQSVQSTWNKKYNHMLQGRPSMPKRMAIAAGMKKAVPTTPTQYSKGVGLNRSPPLPRVRFVWKSSE